MSWLPGRDLDLPTVPAVYELEGRQYIAVTVAAGNSPTVSRELNNEPQAPGSYMVFALPE